MTLEEKDDAIFILKFFLDNEEINKSEYDKAIEKLNTYPVNKSE